MTGIIILAVLLELVSCGFFFYLGYVVGDNKELRLFVVTAVALAIVGTVSMALLKGAGELIGMAPILSWIAGVALGALAGFIKARRAGK